MERKKITYFLGAGASFFAIPIWDGQGSSMKDVSEQISVFLQHQLDFKGDKQLKKLKNNQSIKNLIHKLKFYGDKAIEFGTLDIYARNLYLLQKKNELNDLKFHLSIYFDIWENFIPSKYRRNHRNMLIDDNKIYDKIDKRYYSLLAVILEKNDKKNPLVHDDVNFISWNYDLQLEMAYRSFMNNPEKQNLETINEDFNFFNDKRHKKNIHLNGFRGVFDYKDKLHSIIEKNQPENIGDYLSSFLEKKDMFLTNGISYEKRIKYAWEENSESVKQASKVLKETDILVIIGYSFPSYNRKIDTQLLLAFEGAKNKKNKRIIYQNPSDNSELLKSITDIKVEYFEDTKQFYIPQEFLIM